MYCRVSLIRQTAVGFIYQFLTLVCDGRVARQRTRSKVRRQKRGGLGVRNRRCNLLFETPMGERSWWGFLLAHRKELLFAAVQPRRVRLTCSPESNGIHQSVTAGEEVSAESTSLPAVRASFRRPLLRSPLKPCVCQENVCSSIVVCSFSSTTTPATPTFYDNWRGGTKVRQLTGTARQLPPQPSRTCSYYTPMFNFPSPHTHLAIRPSYGRCACSEQ